MATVVGFLIASVIPVALFALRGHGEYELGLLPILYFFSAMATLLFGVPTFFLLRHFKLIRWWSALVVGFAIGAIVAGILPLPAPPMADDVLFMGPVGAVSAFGFWLIWKLGRDDQNSHGVIS